MELAFFSTLYNAQLIDEKIYTHLEQIRQHKGRVEMIEKQRSEKQQLLEKKESDLKNAKAQLQEGEKELYAITQNLTKAKENLSMASNQKQLDSLESEIKNLVPKADQWENSLLELMEQIEINEEEIKQHQDFLHGSLETLSEIKEEVSKEIEKEECEISTLNKKIEDLLIKLPNNIQESYKKINEKYRFKKPLSFAINRQCGQCKFDIGGNNQTQIDTGRVLEFCPGCGRILIPLAAKTS